MLAAGIPAHGLLRFAQCVAGFFAVFQQKHGRPPRSAGIWIGPEGDFTLEELQQIERSGAQPVTLGDLTLRVETAAIYGLSILNYELSFTTC